MNVSENVWRNIYFVTYISENCYYVIKKQFFQCIKAEFDNPLSTVFPSFWRSPAFKIGLSPVYHRAIVRVSNWSQTANPIAGHLYIIFIDLTNVYKWWKQTNNIVVILIPNSLSVCHWRGDNSAVLRKKYTCGLNLSFFLGQLSKCTENPTAWKPRVVPIRPILFLSTRFFPMYEIFKSDVTIVLEQ